MNRQARHWYTRATAAMTIGVLLGTPSILADTGQAVTTQDLTSLGSLSVGITGLPDSTFGKNEQAYQGSLTGTSSWRGFSHQLGRTITIQFQKPVDVTHVQITALQDPQLGVVFPSEVEFQFEQNGTWYTAGARPSAIPLSGQKVTKQTFGFDSAGIEASAVRLYIPVSVWVFVNGVDVQGSTTTQGQPASTYAQVANSAPDSGPLSPTSPSSAGIQNMLLVETGANGNQGLWPEQNFEPMVAYEDTTGKMIAPMFDTMLFLPYGSVPNTMTGLTKYMSDLFAPNQQLSALDAAVAASNTALSRPDYKEKVVLSIPFFRYGATDFGMVNGQDVNFAGSATDPNAIQARETAVQWYVSTLLSQWNQANFQHLQLVGLYWDEEQYDTTMPGEQSFVSFASSEVHAQKLPLFWIPYYGADQTDNWKSLGFDAAWIQPNYVELGTAADTLRISNGMETANKYGMGIEVELSGLNASNQTLYSTFLNKLDVEGFGQNQVTHAFYDGSKLLVTAAASPDAAERNVYDETAAFIQGK